MVRFCATGFFCYIFLYTSLHTVCEYLTLFGLFLSLKHNNIWLRFYLSREPLGKTYFLCKNLLGKNITVLSMTINLLLILLGDLTNLLEPPQGLLVDPHKGHQRFKKDIQNSPSSDKLAINTFHTAQFHMPFVSLCDQTGHLTRHFLCSCCTFFLKPIGTLLLLPTILWRGVGGGGGERNDGPIIALDVRGEYPGGGWGPASLVESCTFLGSSVLKCVPF